MKAIEQFFPVVLFVKLYKVVLTFESVDNTLKCDPSSESSRPVLSFFRYLKNRILYFKIFLPFYTSPLLSVKGV